jgi:DNA-binding beta-propeller fold protein YncE
VRPALALALALSPLALAGAADNGNGNGNGSRPGPMGHARGEKSIAGLRPEVVIRGGFYSGQFGTPAGIFCDPKTGEIFVADRATNSIEIFDATGASLYSFSDDEHLREPSRIAVDDDGRIYVIDLDRTRIKVFDYRGEFLSHLELPGFGAEEKPTFTAMTFDATNGDLWVGDSRTGQVVAFDRRLQPKMRIGTFGDGQGQLDGIAGIALDERNVYVASQEGIAVQIFTRQGRFVRGWGMHDAGLHNVSLPAGIAVDAKGRVILLDTLRQEIKYFDPDGKLIELFGGLGRQAGAVAYPTDLGMDRKGRLCVADSGNGRAQVLAPVESADVPGAIRPGPGQQRRRPSAASAAPVR